jgi:hypothetical protein
MQIWGSLGFGVRTGRLMPDTATEFDDFVAQQWILRACPMAPGPGPGPAVAQPGWVSKKGSNGVGKMTLELEAPTVMSPWAVTASSSSRPRNKPLEALDSLPWLL